MKERQAVAIAFALLAATVPGQGSADEGASETISSISQDSLTFQLPPAGSTLRIVAPTVRESWLIGSLEGAYGDTLRIATADDRTPVLLPLSSVIRLENSPSRGNHAGTGRLVGFLVGAGLLGATVGATAATDDPDYAAITVPASVIAGGLLGLLIGGAVGASIEDRHWTVVSLHKGARFIPVGSSIRAKTGSPGNVSIDGVLLAPIADSLSVMRSGGAVMSTPAARLDHLEVSLGRKPPSAASARVGLGLGMVAGGTIGGLMAHESVSGSYGSFIAAGAVLGAATGWAVGRLLGRLGSGEVWEEISVE